MSDVFSAEELEKFIADNLDALRNFAKSQLPGRQGTYQATDLINDMYVKIRAYCEKYEGKALSPALLFTSMRRIAIDYKRKKARRKQLNLGDEQLVEAHSEGKSNDEILERQAFAANCFSKLSKHDSEAAEVFSLHEFLDFSFEEIAEMIKTPEKSTISESTIRRRYQRATTYLKVCTKSAENSA